MNQMYAAFEDIFRNLPEVIAAMMFFGVPMVWILTNHQRKMAELIHGRSSVQNEQVLAALMQEVQQLRSEVAYLRDQNNQRMLAHEASVAERLSPPVTPEVRG